MITRSFYDAMFESIRHGFSYDEAQYYVHKLTHSFMYGTTATWNNVLAKPSNDDDE